MRNQLALSARGVLHRWPAWESCNLDSASVVTVRDTIEQIMDTGKYRRHCKRCFGPESVEHGTGALPE